MKYWKRKKTLPYSLCANYIHSDYKLYIISSATTKLLNYIGWGRKNYTANTVEQGGWLVGYYEESKDGKNKKAVVTHVLPAYKAIGTPASLDWPAEEDIRLQRKFFFIQEEYLKQKPAGNRIPLLIGWFHTHPNQLPVFLSSIDMQNIKLKFNSSDQFSLVLNPHRRIWKAFVGPNGLSVSAQLDPREYYKKLEQYDNIEEED